MSQDRTLCIWPFWCLLLWQKSFYKTQQVCVLRALDVWGSLQLSWRSQWCPTFPPLCHALTEFLLDVNPDSSLLPVLWILPLTSVSFFFSLSFLFFLFLLSFHVVSRVGVLLSFLSEDCASLIQFFFYMFYFSKYFFNSFEFGRADRQEPFLLPTPSVGKQHRFISQSKLASQGFTWGWNVVAVIKIWEDHQEEWW